MPLCIAIVIKRGPSFVVVVIRFSNSKIIHATITCLSSIVTFGEVQAAFHADQDCIFIFLFSFVICLISSALYCARYVV
jgi:hypothetical protein